MSSNAKNRLALRNQRLKTRAQVAAKGEKQQKVLLVPDLEKRLREFDDKERSVRQEISEYRKVVIAMDSLEFRITKHGSHYAGEGSAAVNSKFRSLENQLHSIQENREQFRKRHDPSYQVEKEEEKRKETERQAKLRSWGIEKLGVPQKDKKKKGVEILVRFHSELANPQSSLRCSHFNSETTDSVECDCSRTFRCGCQENSVCAECKTTVCDHEAPKYTKVVDKTKCEGEDDAWDSLFVVRMEPSTRAKALRARGKMDIQLPKLKIDRQHPGLILVNDEDTKMQKHVRCYHLIEGCDVYVRCDCLRDPKTGDFIVNAKAYSEQGITWTVDQKTVDRDRARVRFLPPNACMVNPTGLLGQLSSRKTEPEETSTDQLGEFFSINLDL